MEKRNKRRLFLISNMYPSRSSIRYGIFVKRWEEAINKQYNVHKTVLTKKNNFSSKLFGYLALYFKVLRICLRANKKDVVYIHYPLYFSPLLMFFIWRKIPLVINFHGSDSIFDTKIKQAFAIWLRIAVSKCDIVAPSSYYKQKLGEIFNIKTDKIFVYPSGGIDHGTFYPFENKKSSLVLGYVSNFILKKGWSVFLDALSILKEENKIPPFKGIMVGDGPDLKRIKEQIKAKNLDVTILRSVEQSKLAKIYAMFSIFIFPTYREDESLGLVGLEAMACGLPVIAGNVGGPMSYLNHGVNGFLFNKEDSADLAQKIITYINLSESEKNKIIYNSLKTAKKYESKKVGHELLDWLDTIYMEDHGKPK